MHVGTHGPCVRSINHAICFQFPLSGRTSRASLHASKHATRPHVNLFTRQLRWSGRTSRASLHAYRGRIDVQNG